MRLTGVVLCMDPHICFAPKIEVGYSDQNKNIFYKINFFKFNAKLAICYLNRQIIGIIFANTKYKEK